MDEGCERQGKKWCKTFTKKPSVYVHGSNLFFSCEVEEKTLPYVLEIVGEGFLIFASDFFQDRKREEFNSNIDILLEHEDVTDAQKNNILSTTPRDFPPEGQQLKWPKKGEIEVMSENVHLNAGTQPGLFIWCPTSYLPQRINFRATGRQEAYGAKAAMFHSDNCAESWYRVGYCLL